MYERRIPCARLLNEAEAFTEERAEAGNLKLEKNALGEPEILVSFPRATRRAEAWRSS